MSGAASGRYRSQRKRLRVGGLKSARDRLRVYEEFNGVTTHPVDSEIVRRSDNP